MIMKTTLVSKPEREIQRDLGLAGFSLAHSLKIYQIIGFFGTAQRCGDHFINEKEVAEIRFPIVVNEEEERSVKDCYLIGVLSERDDKLYFSILDWDTSVFFSEIDISDATIEDFKKSRLKSIIKQRKEEILKKFEP